VLCFLTIATIWVWRRSDIPEVATFIGLSAATIEYPSEFNYRQTLNDCGPFNVAAVVRALTKQEIDSAAFAEDISWRLPNKYTLPWGMEKQLKQHGIAIEVPHVAPLSDNDKIAFLQEQLSQQKPVIILGERDNYEHYLTIFGFDAEKNEFFIYDSLFEKGEDGFTIDSNGSLPGNRNLTAEEVLHFWRGGGMYGLFTWYAIVASYES
jgi:hypothetical protein